MPPATRVLWPTSKTRAPAATLGRKSLKPPYSRTRITDMRPTCVPSRLAQIAYVQTIRDPSVHAHAKRENPPLAKKHWLVSRGLLVAYSDRARGRPCPEASSRYPAPCSAVVERRIVPTSRRVNKRSAWGLPGAGRV